MVSKKLEPIKVGDTLLKPTTHLQELFQGGQVVFKLDDGGYPEIWLGGRLWEVSGAGWLPEGTVFDPGAAGPVVRLMSLEDQAFIVAWIGAQETPSLH